MLSLNLVVEAAKIRVLRMNTARAYSQAVEVYEDEPTVITRRKAWQAVVAEKKEGGR